MSLNIDNCPFCGVEFNVELDIECVTIFHPISEDCPISLVWCTYEHGLYTEKEIEELWNKRS